MFVLRKHSPPFPVVFPQCDPSAVQDAPSPLLLSRSM